METTGGVRAAMSREGQCPYTTLGATFCPLRVTAPATPSPLPPTPVIHLHPVPPAMLCPPLHSLLRRPVPTATSCPQSHLLSHSPCSQNYSISPLHHSRLQCHPVPSVTICSQWLLMSPQSLPAPCRPSVASVCPIPVSPPVTSFPGHLVSLSPVSRPITSVRPLSVTHPVPSRSYIIPCRLLSLPVRHGKSPCLILSPCHPLSPPSLSSPVPSPRSPALSPRPIAAVTRCAHARCSR